MKKLFNLQRKEDMVLRELEDCITKLYYDYPMDSVTALMRDIRKDKEVLICSFGYIDWNGLDIDYIHKNLLQWFDTEEVKPSFRRR